MKDWVFAITCCTIIAFAFGIVHANTNINSYGGGYTMNDNSLSCFKTNTLTGACSCPSTYTAICTGGDSVSAQDCLSGTGAGVAFYQCYLTVSVSTSTGSGGDVFNSTTTYQIVGISTSSPINVQFPATTSLSASITGGGSDVNKNEFLFIFGIFLFLGSIPFWRMVFRIGNSNYGL